MCGGQVKVPLTASALAASEAPQGEIVSTITDGWCRPVAHRAFGDPRRRVAVNLCGMARHGHAKRLLLAEINDEMRNRDLLLGAAAA
jgi:hypothetical protein